MVNTEIRLIMFFAAEDGEALYNQHKQDQELTVAQIMNSLLQSSDLNWRTQGKPLGHSDMIYQIPYNLYSGDDRFKRWDLRERARESVWRTTDRGL